MARRYAKFIAALVGAAVQAASLGLVSGDAQSWVTVAVGVLTALGVYQVPNAEPAVAEGV